MLLRKLAACGVDVVAARVPDGGLDANLGEPANKLIGTLLRGGLELGSLEVIELNQVDVSKGPASEVAKGLELGVIVVHTTNEGILVGRPSAGGLDILAHNLMKSLERVLLDARHDEVSRGLDGRVKRDGKRELLGLLGEATNHGNNTAGRDRKVTGANARALGRLEHAKCLEDLVVVVERLALAHHHDTRRTRLEIVAHVHNLVVNLSCLEGALEATLARSAEDASHAASGLRGDADGQAISRGHTNALGLRAIRIAKQILSASVIGDLAGHLVRSAEGATLLEIYAKSCGNVRHLLEVGDVVLPNPVLDLLGAKLGVAKLVHKLEELLVGKRPQVNLAAARLCIMERHVAAFLA